MKIEEVSTTENNHKIINQEMEDLVDTKIKLEMTETMNKLIAMNESKMICKEELRSFRRDGKGHPPFSQLYPPFCQSGPRFINWGIHFVQIPKMGDNALVIPKTGVNALQIPK